VNCPLSHETLVDYWSQDLPDAESLAIEEHLFSCPACFEAAAKFAALATAIREALPPVVTEADLERLRARGVAVGTNDFVPGESKEAWMRRGTDILIHRLRLANPAGIEKVRVEFETLGGAPLFTFEEAPIDASGAVLVACQRHFRASFPDPDMRIRVLGESRAGKRVEETYTVLHRFE
jgi:hypothetical protein